MCGREGGAQPQLPPAGKISAINNRKKQEKEGEKKELSFQLKVSLPRGMRTGSGSGGTRKTGGDGGRNRETEGDGGRRRETKEDGGRWRKTQGDVGRRRETEGNSRGRKSEGGSKAARHTADRKANRQA